MNFAPHLRSAPCYGQVLPSKHEDCCPSPSHLLPPRGLIFQECRFALECARGTSDLSSLYRQLTSTSPCKNRHVFWGIVGKEPVKLITHQQRGFLFRAEAESRERNVARSERCRRLCCPSAAPPCSPCSTPRSVLIGDGYGSMAKADPTRHHATSFGREEHISVTTEGYVLFFEEGAALRRL